MCTTLAHMVIEHMYDVNKSCRFIALRVYSMRDRDFYPGNLSESGAISE